MSTDFVVSAKNNPTRLQSNVSKGDAELYTIDFTPWQEDNDTIISTTWTLESGDAAITGQSLVSGVASALVTFTNSGRNMVSVLATTATAKKKAWIEILARDQQLSVDDYGAC